MVDSSNAILNATPWLVSGTVVALGACAVLLLRAHRLRRPELHGFIVLAAGAFLLALAAAWLLAYRHQLPLG